MDWIKLAIPLIAVAVWILSNLANQQKETRKPPRVPTFPPPRPRDPVEPLATASRPKENDDTYREEMDRKREKKPSVAKPLPRPRPRRTEAAPKPPPLVLRPAPAPAPTSRSKDYAPLDQTATSLFLTVPIPLPPEPVAKVGEPAVLVVKPKPAAIKNMLELLKKRESLTTAFLLKEVLDLPVSKRPRRRM